MEDKKQASVTPLKSDELAEIADFSHRKGDIQLITLSKDKLDAILSASGSINSNFLTLMIGIAVAIFTALKSGGVEESSRAIFWLAFYFSLILTVFFAALTLKEELKKRRLKKEILRSYPQSASRDIS